MAFLPFRAAPRLLPIVDPCEGKSLPGVLSREAEQLDGRVAICSSFEAGQVIFQPILRLRGQADVQGLLAPDYDLPQEELGLCRGQRSQQIRQTHPHPNPVKQELAAQSVRTHRPGQAHWQYLHLHHSRSASPLGRSQSASRLGLHGGPH